MSKHNYPNLVQIGERLIIWKPWIKINLSFDLLTLIPLLLIWIQTSWKISIYPYLEWIGERIFALSSGYSNCKFPQHCPWPIDPKLNRNLPFIIRKHTSKLVWIEEKVLELSYENHDFKLIFLTVTLNSDQFTPVSIGFFPSFDLVWIDERFLSYNT